MAEQHVPPDRTTPPGPVPPVADARVAGRLRCPVCRAALTPTPGALRCPAGHAFDLARQGYVNLTAGRAPHTGDTADMVAARAAVLDAGHLAVVSAALAGAARAALRRCATDADAPPLVVDAGGGTGHHLAAVLDAAPQAWGLTIDASKPAVRRAARAHPRAAAVLADGWGPLPLADGAAAVLLNVFAPRNGGEFRRVLRRDGTLLVVTPEADHLATLVAALGLLRVDADKRQRVAAALPGFRVADSAVHTAALRLDHAQAAAVVGMGPSARHTEPAALARRLAALPDPIATTVRVRLTALHPDEGAG